MKERERERKGEVSVTFLCLKLRECDAAFASITLSHGRYLRAATLLHRYLLGWPVTPPIEGGRRGTKEQLQGATWLTPRLSKGLKMLSCLPILCPAGLKESWSWRDKIKLFFSPLLKSESGRL